MYWYHNYRNQKGLGDMLTLGWSPWDSVGSWWSISACKEIGDSQKGAGTVQRFSDSCDVQPKLCWEIAMVYRIHADFFWWETATLSKWTMIPGAMIWEIDRSFSHSCDHRISAEDLSKHDGVANGQERFRYGWTPLWGCQLYSAGEGRPWIPWIMDWTSIDLWGIKMVM